MFKKYISTYWNLLTATTTGTPKNTAFSICFLKLQKPFSTNSMFWQKSS